MIRRFIYQKKPVFTQADTALFQYKWRVQYGFSCVVFKTYEEAVRFCRERFYDLDGKPLKGGRA